MRFAFLENDITTIARSQKPAVYNRYRQRQAHLSENAVRLQVRWSDSLGKIAPAKQQSAAGGKMPVQSQWSKLLF